MACTNCGHNDWVTIGNTKYCAHCGEPANATTGAPKATEVNPVQSASTALGTLVAPQVAPIIEAPAASIQPTVPVTPVPLPKPANRPRTMSDISTSASAPTLRQPNPAHSYHSAAAPTDALDLRPKTENAPAASIVPAKPLEISKPTPSQRLARAAAVPKSPAVQRFTSPVSPIVAAPATEPEPVAQPQPVEKPASAVVPPERQPTLPELPNYVATQLQSMQELIPPTAASKPEQPVKSKAAKPPKALSIAAAGMTAAILAGYIWLNNYDSLTIRAAGNKAGIAASAPSYLPASYNLAGPITIGTGSVAMQYKSPSAPGLLTISQSKSAWTSSSLLELYVNQKSKSYLSVESQGLTIFLLDNNQATWVNRGIQYVVQANSAITRDQLLKIAQSL